jgi:hypothetical protein
MLTTRNKPKSIEIQLIDEEPKILYDKFITYLHTIGGIISEASLYHCRSLKQLKHLMEVLPNLDTISFKLQALEDSENEVVVVGLRESKIFSATFDTIEDSKWVKFFCSNFCFPSDSLECFKLKVVTKYNFLHDFGRGDVEKMLENQPQLTEMKEETKQDYYWRIYQFDAKAKSSELVEMLN